MINAIGLENVGIDIFLAEKLPYLIDQRGPVVVNIFGNTLDEYGELAARLDGTPGIAAIEINISCPNVKMGGMLFGTDPAMAATAVNAVRQATTLPLITKLTPNVTDITNLARGAEQGESDGCDAGVTGRAAEQFRVFGFWGLDGIQGGGADDQHAHNNAVQSVLLEARS